MTTHQLATLLEHLQRGFGDSLKSETGKNFTEAVSAFRELPEQPLKELVKTLKKANAPDTPTKPQKPAKVTVDVPALIDRIRSIRNGGELGDVELEVTKLNNSQLKEILNAFGQKPTTTTTGNATKVRQLYQSIIQNGSHVISENNHSHGSGLHPTLDMGTVEEGVRLFNELRDNQSLSIQDVRARFERLRELPKAEIEEISRRLNYSPSSSKKETLDRLLSNLEGLKMIQFRMDQIMTGT